MKYKSHSRVLGECPSCGLEDEIYVFYDTKVNALKARCKGCKSTKERYRLISENREAGNRLIPVSIENLGNLSVWVNTPERDEIPFSNLVTTILNSALMGKFGLTACFATEGGVGKRGRYYFDLTNYGFDHVGLNIDEAIPTIMRRQRRERNYMAAILKLYEKMLCNLFLEPLSLGDTKIRRGQILWLDEEKDTENDALICLFAALNATAGRDFATSSLRKAEEVSHNPILSRYTQGLSDKDIVRFFVNPPISLKPNP